LVRSQDPSATPHRGSLVVIFLTVFIDLLGFGIVLPLLPVYGEQFATEHGYTTAQAGWLVGLLMASFSAMQFLFLPVWGRLSDLYGRRPILLLGLAGSTVSYALFALATTWHSLPWLFVTRIGAGIAGATISTAQAYIADTTSVTRRTHGMALIGAAFALGFTVGPVIGAVALLLGTSADASPWPGYFAAGLSGTAFCLAVRWLPESRTATAQSARRSLLDLEGLRVALTTPSIGLLQVTSFIVVCALAAFESTLALAIKTLYERFQLAPSDTGVLSRVVDVAQRLGYDRPADVRHVVVLGTFAYLGLVMTLAQGFFVRRFAGRISEASMAVGGTVMSAVSLVLLSVAFGHSSYGWLCLAMAVFVIGLAFVTPSLQSLISRRTSPAQQGHVLGVTQSLSSLARIAGPVLGIRLFAYSPQVPLWSAAVIMAVAALLTVAAARTGVDYGAAA
jgi:MFS family permease